MWYFAGSDDYNSALLTKANSLDANKQPIFNFAQNRIHTINKAVSSQRIASV